MNTKFERHTLEGELNYIKVLLDQVQYHIAIAGAYPKVNQETLDLMSGQATRLSNTAASLILDVFCTPQDQSI